MDENPRDRVLDLFENLKGVTFQGIYQGTKDLTTSEGTPIKYHLVKVVSSHVKSKMSAIESSDPNNVVWKSVNGDIIWALSLGDTHVLCDQKESSFIINNVTWTRKELNYELKKFYSVINIDLNLLLQ